MKKYLIQKLAFVFLASACLLTALPAEVKFRYKESYKEKIVRENFDGETFFSEEASSKFTTLAMFSTEGVDIESFNEETPVDIIIGNFAWSATLGEADNYTPGDRSAKFTITEETDEGTTRLGTVV